MDESVDDRPGILLSHLLEAHLAAVLPRGDTTNETTWIEARTLISSHLKDYIGSGSRANVSEHGRLDRMAAKLVASLSGHSPKLKRALQEAAELSAREGEAGVGGSDVASSATPPGSPEVADLTWVCGSERSQALVRDIVDCLWPPDSPNQVGRLYKHYQL